MGCDMVVALGRATVDGSTLFGHNGDLPNGEYPSLVHVPGRAFAPGETVRARYVEVPQVRQTFTVLGSKLFGAWGLHHGVNDQGVAAGCTRYHHKLQREQPGLVGPELVRLVLERSHSAAHGVDVLAELLERYGQGAFPGCRPADAGDFAFLVADGREAFLVETSAAHWVYQQILEVRAESNHSTVRQDWNRISPGLGQHAISQGWWPGDGSKLDFADALGVSPVGEASGLRRWGRATLLLEQQNGHIDVAFVRRLLGDHYEGTNFEIDLTVPEGPLPLCQHGQGGQATAASFIARLHPNDAGRTVVDYVLGPPCLSVYFPLVLDGDLPWALLREGAEPLSLRGRLVRLLAHIQADPDLGGAVREQFGRLQSRFDQAADDWNAEAPRLREQGEGLVRQRATAFMQQHVEAFETVLAELLPRQLAPEDRSPVGSGR